MIRALVISGYGINCEKEMAAACTLAGAETSVVHARDLLTGSVRPDAYRLLAFPGGFSFGDELGAAKAFANRIIHSGRLQEALIRFVEGGGCILGVCNGFQLLVKLGILPDMGAQNASLAYNDSGRFEARWVNHAVAPTHCVFSRGIDTMRLPIRHGEGKFVAADSDTVQSLFARQQVVFQYADAEGIPAMTYPANPNGSLGAIAGVCDRTGRVMGMMAHPEAAVWFTNHPQWTRMKENAKRDNRSLPEYGDGLRIFKNVVDYLKEA